MRLLSYCEKGTPTVRPTATRAFPSQGFEGSAPVGAWAGFQYGLWITLGVVATSLLFVLSNVSFWGPFRGHFDSGGPA